MTSDELKKLTINEIFFSIQGESYLAGLPCVFVRLTGCHQRCTYCDTEYAFYEGQKMTLSEIESQISNFPCKNVLLTGGEPLLQSSLPLLAERLINKGYQVAIETSGNRDLSVLPRQVVKVMDLKTPQSGEASKNNLSNLEFLDSKDEIKFVCCDESDVDWALKFTSEYKLYEKCHVSLSQTVLTNAPMVAAKVLESGMPIRHQVQMHKVIWPEKEKGF